MDVYRIGEVFAVPLPYPSFAVELKERGEMRRTKRKMEAVRSVSALHKLCLYVAYSMYSHDLLVTTFFQTSYFT